MLLASTFVDATNVAQSTLSPDLQEKVLAILASSQKGNTEGNTSVSEGISVRTVPFYSQFNDISAPNWQKVGCGIAATSMLIDYYSDEPLSVDGLLDRGIASGAFLTDAGWTHQGLINLTKVYGLDGRSVSLSAMSADAAFVELERVLEDGPVMASVYYTFTPGHPIPHLVVINDVKDGLVYYNDPAEPHGGGTISIEKFKPAWKQRYIAIRPTS